MPDFKEIKKNIEEINVDMLNRQEERRSFNAPNPSLKEEAFSLMILKTSVIVSDHGELIFRRRRNV